MPVSSSNLRGALLSLASFGVYASHDVLVKFLGGSYSPVQTIFFAGLLGFPLMTIMLMSDRTDGNLIPKHPWWTAIRTISAVATGLAGFYAFSVLPMAQCYAIFFAMPILITLLAIPILGERIGLRRGIAVVAGLGGVLIVLRPGEVDLGLGHLAWDDPRSQRPHPELQGLLRLDHVAQVLPAEPCDHTRQRLIPPPAPEREEPEPEQPGSDSSHHQAFIGGSKAARQRCNCKQKVENQQEAAPFKSVNVQGSQQT